MMPGMDGPATAREIRRRERMAALPPIPIVALTASALPEDRRHLLESGMDDHIAKPFQAEDLRRVLGTWLPSTRRTMVIPSPAPPARPGEGEGTTAETIVDPVTFARLADLGDASFVDRIVRLFLADAAERVAQVDEALEEGDVLRMRRALHALEGICGNVGAVALDRRAREIHDRIGRREDRGEEPLARAFRPTGLEDLLARTRAWFRSR
jgi:two-component system sensor histidine kinase BarA